MTTTSRRGFLKGLGATLAAVGVTTAGSAAATPIQPSARVDLLTGIALAHAPSTSNDGMERTMISPGQLAMLVAEHLNEQIAQRETFTAYDVTRTLRRAHPTINIVHPEVRNVVHRRMRSVVAAQFYRQAIIQFPTGSACRYIPNDSSI